MDAADLGIGTLVMQHGNTSKGKKKDVLDRQVGGYSLEKSKRGVNQVGGSADYQPHGGHGDWPRLMTTAPLRRTAQASPVLYVKPRLCGVLARNGNPALT